MTAFPAYIAARFLSRVLVFLEHWYAGGFRALGSATLGLLARLDRTFAVAITLRHFFEPLYQDRSFIGFVLGIIFRTLRALIGLSIYTVVILVASTLYIAWGFVLPYVVYKLFEGAF